MKLTRWLDEAIERLGYPEDADAVVVIAMSAEDVDDGTEFDTTLGVRCGLIGEELEDMCCDVAREALDDHLATVAIRELSEATEPGEA